MKKSPLFAIAACAISSCATAPTRPQAVMLDDDRADVIEDAPTPTRVLEAARSAVPRFVLRDTDVKIINGVSFYDLEGTADGKKYEIAVTAGGRVLQVRRD